MIGFLVGIKHATEADHVAAVPTLVTRSRSLAHSLLHGVTWGIGHCVTLLLIGGFVLAMGTSIPQRLALALELLVGVMLIALGADVLRQLIRRRIHVHIHTHESGVRHVHAHSHAHPQAGHDWLHDHPHAGSPLWRALAVGMTHGLAGSAALLVLGLGAAQS